MKMEQGARIVVEDWLHAQSDDVLHFITDETKLREAEAFAAAARQVGAIPKLTVLPSASIQAGDSVAQMRRIMSYATAVIGATSDSFITTDAVDYVLRRGARFLSLPLSCSDGRSLLEQDFLAMNPAGCRPDGAAFAALPAPRRPRSHHHQTGYGHHLRYPGTEAGSVSRCYRPSRSLRLGKL